MKSLGYAVNIQPKNGPHKQRYSAVLRLINSQDELLAAPIPAFGTIGPSGASFSAHSRPFARTADALIPAASEEFTS
jgi:hypothetical protein